MTANRDPFRVLYNAGVDVGDHHYTIEVSEIINAENLPNAINIAISHAKKWTFAILSVEQLTPINMNEKKRQKGA